MTTSCYTEISKVHYRASLLTLLENNLQNVNSIFYIASLLIFLGKDAYNVKIVISKQISEIHNISFSSPLVYSFTLRITYRCTHKKAVIAVRLCFPVDMATKN